MKKILFVFGIALLGGLLGVLVLPSILLIILTSIDKILLGGALDPTISVSLTVIWGPIAGVLIGILIGIRVALLSLKRPVK